MSSRISFSRILVLGLAAVLLTCLSAYPKAPDAPATVRVGFFPNITHAQALIGKSDGWFQNALGSSVKVEWTAFNAGPSAIEAIFAGAIDMAYTGPNPSISGYVKSDGQALRVVAGATSGGASLIVRGDSGINKPEDFHGKRIASPQQGNTQDVALRYWLSQHGMKTTDKGGDVQVIPIANADQLTLFLRKQIDAAWAPEPWATRLIHEAGGRLFLDERSLWPDGQFVITELNVNEKFLSQHPDIVEKWVRAHVDVTEWINQHPAEAHRKINDQIQKETGKALPLDMVEEAFNRMQVTYDPIRSSLLTSADRAFAAGFLGKIKPDLSGLYDLTALNKVLKEKKRKAIQ
jgi:NitT/TauT family transport system substrate-binding protein